MGRQSKIEWTDATRKVWVRACRRALLLGVLVEVGSDELESCGFLS
jgi:hypothetical protein